MQINAEGLHIINLYDEDYWIVENVEDAEKAVNLFVRIPLTSNQFSALVSFVISLGIEEFRHSQLLRLVNRNALLKAAQEFMLYTKAEEKADEAIFLRRRELERALFLKPEIVPREKSVT